MKGSGRWTGEHTVGHGEMSGPVEQLRRRAQLIRAQDRSKYGSPVPSGYPVSDLAQREPAPVRLVTVEESVLTRGDAAKPGPIHRDSVAESANVRVRLSTATDLTRHYPAER
jgi:hypothetical protein